MRARIPGIAGGQPRKRTARKRQRPRPVLVVPSGLSWAVGAVVVGITLVAGAVLVARPTSAVPPATAGSPSKVSPRPIPSGHFRPMVHVPAQAQPATEDSAAAFHCQKPSAPYYCYGPTQI